MTKNEEKWAANYESFRVHVMNNAKMPGDDVKSSIGVSLHGWYRNQRDKYNEGKLGRNEVALFNKIVPGMLEKSAQEINLELYLRYKKYVHDRYNPEVIYLYRKCAIDYSFAKACIVRGKYKLADILQCSKYPEDLFYHCIKTVCDTPSRGICKLYGFVSGEESLSGLYLKDKYKFVDYYVTVLNNFNSDYSKFVEICKLTPRDVGVIDMRCEGKTLQEIGKRYNITRDKVNLVFSKAIRRIRAVATYNEKGICTFGRYELNHGEPVVTGIDKSKIRDPYTDSFESMNVLSVRAFSCLKRMNITNFEELHNFLVSVDKGDTGNYIGGLTEVRNLGAKSAKEVYDLAVELGIVRKVFFR